MSKEDELRELLDELVEDVLFLKPYPDEWLEWVVYILKRLDQTSTHVGDLKEYQAFLVHLREECQVRVRTGEWRAPEDKV